MKLSTTALILLSLTHHVFVSSFHTPQPHVVRRRAAADGEATQQRSRGLVYPGLMPTSTTQSQNGCSSSSTALFGIPKMFRWLTDQYPNILNRRLGSAQSIPPIDNFYLDMNGIIHPCTHGNNEDESRYLIAFDDHRMSYVTALKYSQYSSLQLLSLMKLKCSKRSLDTSIDCIKLLIQRRCSILQWMELRHVPK